MGYLGYKPADKPLTAADITDSIITSAKIVDGTIVNADINASAAISGTKISGSFGKVLQVITATDGTERTTTSSSYVTSSNTLSVTITPSSASNKILIIATSNTTSEGDYGYFTIFRGATNLGDSDRGFASTYDAAQGGTGSTTAINYLDSPSSTSALTYQVYFKKTSGTIVKLNFRNSVGNITALEIAG